MGQPVWECRRNDEPGQVEGNEIRARLFGPSGKPVSPNFADYKNKDSGDASAAERTSCWE